MIHYRETYEIVTQESAENGEAEDSGFIHENAEGTFLDMVKLLRGTQPSCWPLSDGENCHYHLWFTSQPGIDYRTGAEETRSYHPATDRDCRYMVKAWRTANRK